MEFWEELKNWFESSTMGEENLKLVNNKTDWAWIYNLERDINAGGKENPVKNWRSSGKRRPDGGNGRAQKSRVGSKVASITKSGQHDDEHTL